MIISRKHFIVDHFLVFGDAKAAPMDTPLLLPLRMLLKLNDNSLTEFVEIIAIIDINVHLGILVRVFLISFYYNSFVYYSLLVWSIEVDCSSWLDVRRCL